jgi:uncharacterized protein DUF559
MLPRMGRRPRIPLELTRGPFTLDEARAAGVTLSALRGRSWQRVGHELYRWARSSDDVALRLNGWTRLLPPSSVFVKLTAAWIRGLDVQACDPVQVALPPGVKLRHREGLDLSQADVMAEVEIVRGFRVTTLERTLLDLSVSMAPVEALTVIDMAVAKRCTDCVALRRYAERMSGRAGAARLRFLAGLSAGAESPMETRLRWLLVSAGLPAPEVQAELYAGGGRFIARADLYFPVGHLVVEFDGGNHRDRLVSDDRRQNSLVEAGYRVLRFTFADLNHRPEAVVAQVRAALAR